jgi:hypothetical protein
MERHRLPNEREIYLARFTMRWTYEGCLEGTPETVSPLILQGLRERAAVILAPA